MLRKDIIIKTVDLFNHNNLRRSDPITIEDIVNFINQLGALNVLQDDGLKLQSELKDAGIPQDEKALMDFWKRVVSQDQEMKEIDQKHQEEYLKREEESLLDEFVTNLVQKFPAQSDCSLEAMIDTVMREYKATTSLTEESLPNRVAGHGYIDVDLNNNVYAKTIVSKMFARDPQEFVKTVTAKMEEYKKAKRDTTSYSTLASTHFNSPIYSPHLVHCSTSDLNQPKQKLSSVTAERRNSYP